MERAVLQFCDLFVCIVIPVFLGIVDQVPGGPAGRRVFQGLTGARRRLDLDRKSLVQTGRNLKSPFQSVRFRPRSEPDWPDF
jgi:hypothetical protein